MQHRQHNCQVCDAPLTTSQKVTRQNVCNNIQCKLNWQKLQQQELHKQAQAQRKQYETTREHAVNTFLESNKLSHDEVTVVEIPYLSNGDSPPPRERIGTFKNYLKNLVNTLSEVSEEQLIGSPNKALLEAAKQVDTHVFCASCRGKCCAKGREFQAFIQRHTLARILDNETLSFTTKNIVDAYLMHIPEKSITNSCLFHTTRGCVLPRELKADICDDFFCDKLSDYINLSARGDAKEKTVVVNRSRNELIRVQQIN